MSYNGVQVSAWFKIENRCHIEYNVCANEVEFTLGGRTDGFDFVATEDGLEQLITVGTEALRDLRATGSDEGDPVG
ncbi:hypothetical protein ALI144C_30370 [Actinosynnema sp. ALI-1.44]|uniref:hypothetical protein n=1 Tax=Actinosynnema sp. ALI-1.44 TaxID=1933779 RepID=UPI00097BD5F6|nr:hypothetical protein [Actinosynnema sp. ALI-1.44]ONI77751.1 hypothetical protein ALI144C_30370 [Actinosynnema sp. ALI-1.44]